MMEKEKYLKHAEIKVNSLISVLSDSESDTLKETGKIKDRLSHKINEVESHCTDALLRRKLLQDKFDHLKEASDNQWNIAQREFETVLEQIETEREDFINKADDVLRVLSCFILEMEENVNDFTSIVRREHDQKISDLKAAKLTLETELEYILSDSTDNWRSKVPSFVDRSRSIKEYIASMSYRESEQQYQRLHQHQDRCITS
jgi:dGTP triphosphohydrolase